MTTDHTILLRSPLTVAEARELLEVLADRSPLLVLDADLTTEAFPDRAAGIEAIEALRREWPDVPMISFGYADDPEVFTRATSADVVAHVPRPGPRGSDDMDAMKRFMDALSDSIRRELLVPRAPLRLSTVMDEAVPVSQRGHRGDSLRRILRKVIELRRNASSPNVTLEVLDFAAEHLERAILFLVRDREILAIGVFGLRESASELRRHASMLRFDVPEDSVVHEVITQQLGRRVTPVGEHALLGEIHGFIGPPARPEAMLLPLVVHDRTIAVIYADNGSRDGELYPGDALSLLMEHAGLQMENFLLRRKLDRLEEGRHT